MGRRFIKTLAIVAVIQFFLTRQAAGRVVEEGRAERMWMLYPLNVTLNAAVWTLLISAVLGVVRVVRRSS